MRLVNNQMITHLYSQAKRSERLRSHLLLHVNHQEKVQRLFIAMLEGSYVEPHYHELPNQWEMFIIIEGKVKVSLYNSDGDVIECFLAGSDTDNMVVEFSSGDIHSIECISPKALLLEIKEGPFLPEFAKVFPNW